MKNKSTSTSPKTVPSSSLVNKYSFSTCGHCGGDSGASEKASNNKYSWSKKGK